MAKGMIHGRHAELRDPATRAGSGLSPHAALTEPTPGPAMRPTLGVRFCNPMGLPVVKCQPSQPPGLPHIVRPSGQLLCDPLT